MDGGPETLFYLASLVDHIQDLTHPGSTWKEGNIESGPACQNEVYRTLGDPLLLTRLWVCADKQVIRPGSEVLQWPKSLRKIFDEWDTLHIHQWWTGDILNQLHVASTALRTVKLTFFFNKFTILQILALRLGSWSGGGGACL